MHSVPKVLLEVLGNLAHETLERQLAKKKLGALLVTTDLTESNGTRPVAVGLLDATGGGGGLTGGLGGQLLARGLATGALAGSLLSASHLRRNRKKGDEMMNLKERRLPRTKNNTTKEGVPCRWPGNPQHAVFAARADRSTQANTEEQSGYP